MSEPCDHYFPYMLPPTDFYLPKPTYCQTCDSFYDAIPSPETKNALKYREEIIFRAIDIVDCVDEDEKYFLLGIQNQLYLTREEQNQFDKIINPVLDYIFPSNN
jgi:hypothetical protein